MKKAEEGALFHPLSFYGNQERRDAECRRRARCPRKSQDGLDEIDRILHQMLMLAELSASEGDMNRDNLQKVLEYLQLKIDRVADRLEKEVKTQPRTKLSRGWRFCH